MQMSKTILDDVAEKSVWFEMEGGGKVLLREISVDDFKSIRKQTIKKKVEFKRVEGKAERFEVEDVNEDLQNELFWDQVIVNWENLYSSQDKPIACTKENKIMLMTKSKRFAKFVSDSIKTLSESEADRAEVAEKN
jgi:hypothetical protein